MAGGGPLWRISFIPGPLLGGRLRRSVAVAVAVSDTITWQQVEAVARQAFEAGDQPLHFYQPAPATAGATGGAAAAGVVRFPAP